MMQGGWIKIYRQMLSWQWWGDSNMVHLFLHLLLTANTEDKKWRKIIVKRGQVIVTRKELSEVLGISEQTIRTCLERLEGSQEITRQATNKYTIVTICNFNNYQEREVSINQQLTNNQPTTNQQRKKKSTPHTPRKEKDIQEREEEKKIYYYYYKSACTREEQQEKQFFFIFYLKGSVEPMKEALNFLSWNQTPERIRAWNEFSEADRYRTAEQRWTVKGRKLPGYTPAAEAVLTKIIHLMLSTDPGFMSGIYNGKKYPLCVDGSIATLTCTEDAYKAVESNVKAVSAIIRSHGLTSLNYNILK